MDAPQSLEQLERMAQAWNVPLNGISTKDTIVDTIPRNGFYIFNIDNSRPVGPVGTHWTGAWCNDGGCAYFDSFGAPAPMAIQHFLLRRYPAYDFNNWVVQDLNSSACGYYVVAFGAHMSRKDTNGHRSAKSAMDNFLGLFVDDTQTNERILSSLVDTISKRGKSWRHPQLM